ncbi:hypothetical protein SAMN04488700_0803 [Carnobacterium iners]|uniref:Uncharacterized protein n=1 Tax=Carnobacterium iners TaxID=1073423 RepID=A0A1X7MUF6_9LACT|nr:Yip1 family protein [Carnobacterium iners]SEL06385.1 hypothetical protein SAMN04488114_12315 [Carnobacterium iners]SMH27958.1 hypothetical protein SAMN04488700_0803 [Carnobacterium iners]
MQQNEKFKDWLFRYQYIYRIRSTDKSKGRFLSALVTDISEMREDVQVVEYNRHKKYALRNVYVGNIEKADRIICTYYDTPPKSYGAYELFNLKEQKKRTLSFILVSSILMILLGIVGTLVYMQYATNAFDLTSFSTILIVLIYGIYFLLLGKVAKGLPSRKTLVRNTSSILALLEIISETKDEKTAFAFIDEGSFGEVGLEALSASHKEKATMFILDSIGSEAPLHISGNDFSKKKVAELKIDHPSSNQNFNYVFSARILEKESESNYYLEKSDLKRKTLNMQNLTKVVELFK